MMLTSQKPLPTILQMLAEETKIFIASCTGCSEVCKTGGDLVCKELKSILEENNKTVVGCMEFDFMCNRTLNAITLSRVIDNVQPADCILALTCGVGVQTLATVTDKYVYPANDSLFTGGYQGCWLGTERCAKCSDCMLEFTGGICPITQCSKSLLNGQCGGAKNGKCEVDKTMDCGWDKIYKKLAKKGKLGKLNLPIKIRDYSKMNVNPNLRRSVLYSYENE